MRRSWRGVAGTGWPRAGAAAVTALAAILYLGRLSDAPARLSPDEAVFAVNAHALATTGSDVSGARIPLFLLITDPLIANHSSVTWWQPTLFYLTAAVFTVTPPAMWSLRLPVAGLAILNVTLMYLVARRLFPNAWYAVLAAAILAMTPAHVILGRQATDYFCPVTVALLWLWALTHAVHRRTWHWPAVAGVVLGVGLYSYITSWVVMPMYFVMTLAVLRVVGQPRGAFAAASIGFLIPLSAALVWLWFHPDMPVETFRNYRVATTARLVERVALYWDYFNPSYLFFSGGADWLWATREAGVFLLAFAVFLPCGAWSICRGPSAPVRRLVLLAFLLVPLPIVAALPESPRHATARAILAVPWGVIVATSGVEWLVQRRAPLPSLLTAALLLGMPVQFAFFARDYFTDYQSRAAFRFDPLHLGEAARYMASSDAPADPPQVLLSELPGGRRAMQWKWHLTTLGREDLWRASSYFREEHVRDGGISAGSLLVLEPNHPRLPDLLEPGPWSLAHVVRDDRGEASAVILRRR